MPLPRLPPRTPESVRCICLDGHRGHLADSPSAPVSPPLARNRNHEPGRGAWSGPTLGWRPCGGVLDLPPRVTPPLGPAGGPDHKGDDQHVTTETTPWKASADVLSVTRPAAALIDRMQVAVSTLQFDSADPRCVFYPITRITEARVGPALVVTDVAEYEGGARQSAVVVSAVVHDDEAAGERLVVIRTHLEDQHTPYEGPVIVFDEHHDAIRAGLVKAVLEVEPGAEHRSRPAPHAPLDLGRDRDDGWAPPTPSDRPRRASVAYEAPPSRVDLRQVSGIALLIAAVVVLLLAIASGSPAAIVAGVVAAGILGYSGARVAGV